MTADETVLNSYRTGVYAGQQEVGIAGLGHLLANSPMVHACIANRRVKKLTGLWLPRSSEELLHLVKTFTESDFNIAAVDLAILHSDAYRRPQ